MLLNKEPRNIVFKTELDNRLSYFNETLFNFFIDNIFNNDNWKGAKVIFVDLYTLHHKKFVDWLRMIIFEVELRVENSF